jgi:hypothetical protein
LICSDYLTWGDEAKVFYWSCGGIHVVLSKPEQRELLNEVTPGPVESVLYDASHTARRRLDRRMSRLLASRLRDDPASFIKRYVQRVAYDVEAHKVFVLLLDAYARIVRRAVLGDFGGDALDDIVDRGLFAGEGARETVTLLSPSRWPWRNPRPIGRLSFLSSTIEKVVGSAESFVLITTQFHVRFGPRFVRVSVPGQRRSHGPVAPDGSDES